MKSKTAIPSSAWTVERAYPDNEIFTLFGKSQHRRSHALRERDVVQLKMLADIVAFDLTHVYLALDVLSSKEDEDEGELSAIAPRKPAILRFTLPQCHVFLRALREFHSLIEVTTPVLEEARRVKNRNGAPTNGGHSTASGEETSLDSILERLTGRSEERPPQAEI